MGRPRKYFSKVEDKRLNCKTCGKEWSCSGDAVEVQCDICLLGQKKAEAASTVSEIKRKMEANPVNQKINNIINSIESNLEEEVVEPKVKRGRGRPRKNPILPVDKKGNTMAKTVKNMEVSGGASKRGRKATVGAAVLGFIQNQKGEVKFNDILNVYSAEREKLGKKGSPEVETRNCFSTLYCLTKSGKIREVSKKSVYSAL